MGCPLAIATIVTFCHGTDSVCDPGHPTGLHLFRAKNNVITFDVEPGEKYELLLPSDDNNRGEWLRSNLVAASPYPGNDDSVVDPLAMAGFKTLGTFKAAPGAKRASLARLQGDNRIAVCRIDPSSDKTALAWLALPFSRSTFWIWNQPHENAPAVPLAWAATFLACLAIAWARDTRHPRPPVPRDVVLVALRGSLMADIILWIALSIVVFEVTDVPRENTEVTIAVPAALFLGAWALRQTHFYLSRSRWAHAVIGIVALFTSFFYITTLAAWTWIAVSWLPQRRAPAKKEKVPVSVVKGLIF